MQTNLRETSTSLTASLPRSILGASNYPPDVAQTRIENFIRQTLPKNDQGEIKRELGWRFMLETHAFHKRGRYHRRPFLTRKQRSACGLLKLPRDGWDYSALQPLRDMWKDYMRQNLELLNGRAPSCSDQEWSGFSMVAAKSELIGAEIEVIRSKVPNQVGISGTLVLETKLTFQIVTAKSKLKTIIKESSVFEFRAGNLKFVVFGKHISTRPGERSAKKIKSVMSPDL